MDSKKSESAYRGCFLGKIRCDQRFAQRYIPEKDNILAKVNAPLGSIADCRVGIIFCMQEVKRRRLQK